MLTWNCTHLYSSFFENAIRDAVTYTEGVGVQCGKCKVEYNSCNTLDNGRLDGGGGVVGDCGTTFSQKYRGGQT